MGEKRNDERVCGEGGRSWHKVGVVGWLDGRGGVVVDDDDVVVVDDDVVDVAAAAAWWGGG